MTIRDATLDAFKRHAREVAFLQHLVDVASLCPTRELVIEDLVQHFGSHHRCLVEIFAVRQRSLRILESWALALCMDAKERGILLRAPGKAFEAEPPDQASRAPARDYRT